MKIRHFIGNFTVSPAFALLNIDNFINPNNCMQHGNGLSFMSLTRLKKALQRLDSQPFKTLVLDTGLGIQLF